MAGDDERYMSAALDLARRGSFTSPNPRVGAVLVRDGRVIAEGWHRGAGTPHAEAVVLSEADARGATLYVTLEPCVHHGHTPPCAPALGDAGVGRVVVAIEDPDPRVGGRGLAHLRQRGVEVVTGVLAAEARAINAPYLHHRTTGRPLVTLKLALSLDGRLTARDGSARWITGASTRRAVHQRRAGVDAVMVGAGTALADDPALTARDVAAPRQPARVVVDAAGRVPARAALFERAGEVAQVIVATTARAPHEIQTAWKETGAEVVTLPASDGGVDLGALVDDLGRRGMLEVFCEGGAALATSLLREGLADRLELHYGPVVLGDGGLGLGDIGVSSLTAARRWRVLDVWRSEDDDVVVTLESRGGES